MEPNNVEPQSTFSNQTFTKQPVFWQLVILMCLLIVIFSSAIVNELSGLTSIAKPPESKPAQYNYGAAAITSQPISTVDLSSVPVSAKAAYVLDLETGEVLYEKNAEQVLPLASVTKLMTALLVHEVLPEDSTIWIDMQAISQEGDSGLLGGETFSLETLNDLVLMTSSNDGAYALAATAGEEILGARDANAFVTAMNVRAEQLNLDSLKFYNPTGLDLPNNTPGAVGSAKDVAGLMKYVALNYPEVLKGTTELSNRFYNETGEYHSAQNTNGTVDQITGLIGSKTGYTPLAGGNLAIAYNAGLNHPIVIVVLGSTRTERFTDVLRLVEAVDTSFIE